MHPSLLFKASLFCHTTRNTLTQPERELERQKSHLGPRLGWRCMAAAPPCNWERDPDNMSAPSKKPRQPANHSLPTAAGTLRQEGAGLELDELYSPGWICLARPQIGQNYCRGTNEDYCIYRIVCKLSPPPKKFSQVNFCIPSNLPLQYLFPRRQGLGLVRIIRSQLITSCPPFCTGSTIMLVCVAQPLTITCTIKFSF